MIGKSGLVTSRYLPPGATTGLSAARGDRRVTLSWTAPSSGGAAITDYVVQYQLGAGSWQTFSDGTSTATSAVVDNLTNGQAYSFRVAAVNSFGTGSYATSAAVTPNGLLEFSVENNQNNFATISYGDATIFIDGGLEPSAALPLTSRSVSGWITAQSAGVLGYEVLINGQAESGSESQVVLGGSTFNGPPRYASGSYSVLAGTIVAFSAFIQSSRFAANVFSVKVVLTPS